jgi:hypothetical protein
MPWKLPAPVAGTAEQAAPNVVPSIIAALADGAAIDGAIDAAGVAAAAVVGAVVAPAFEQAPTKAAAMRRPANAPVRLRLFTLFSPVWWTGFEARCR